MKIWSNEDLLKLASLCNVAYLDNNAEQVKAIGFDPIAEVGDGDCQATICKWGATNVVAIRGTQITNLSKIKETWDNIDGAAVYPARGVAFAAGYWNDLDKLYPQIAVHLDAEDLVITGHSMGGVRAHMAGLLFHTRASAVEVVSFGAPCGGTVLGWNAVYGQSGPTRVVHERDFAPDWVPPLGFTPWEQPAGNFLWLHDGKAEWVKSRTGLNLSVPDHMIDTGYMAALEALVNPPKVEKEEAPAPKPVYKQRRKVVDAGE